MQIELVPLKPEETGQTFQIFKTYLKPVIAEVPFGWDEAYQRENFTSRLQPEWFSWVMYQGCQAGLICHRRKPESLHLHLLVIFSAYQRQGLASQVLSQLKAQAFAQNLALTLSSLKNNHPALNLYQRRGLEINDEDEYCYGLICRG